MTTDPDSIRILVVDDMAEIRRIIAHFLRRMLFCEIEEAEDGLDGVSLLLRRQFQLVITDLSMPRMTGLEFIGFIQQRDDLRDIPVLVLTSFSDEQSHMQAMGLRARAFLQKPFSPQKLMQALAEIVPPEFIRGNIPNT